MYVQQSLPVNATLIPNPKVCVTGSTALGYVGMVALGLLAGTLVVHVISSGNASELAKRYEFW